MAMRNINEEFTTLDADQLVVINGGGFAYDVGRVLRFFVMSGGGHDPAMMLNAVGDWIANDVANNAANG